MSYVNGNPYEMVCPFFIVANLYDQVLIGFNPI